MTVVEEQDALQVRDKALEEIAARLGVRAERGKRFAELTSLRVGGAIDWVISPLTEEQAAAVVYELEKAGIGWRALGSGSNVLADDAEHHYVVLSLSEMKGEVKFDGECVSVSAGYSLPRLCIDVARQGCRVKDSENRTGGGAVDECRCIQSRNRNRYWTVEWRVSQVVGVSGDHGEWNYRQPLSKTVSCCWERHCLSTDGRRQES
jgi:hypothetical protein